MRVSIAVDLSVEAGFNTRMVLDAQVGAASRSRKVGWEVRGEDGCSSADKRNWRALMGC